jgi:tetratricopeptide (TPR) repeat protein
MNTARHIPWFNPREMDDETVLMLSTGREKLLAQLFDAVRERLAYPGTFKHWLLTGTRGAGKSFFLRLVQSSFEQAIGNQARFVLLPEEHRNIYAPHEFLIEVQRMLNVHQGDIGTSPAWRVDNQNKAWETALADLLKAYSEPLLVIGVENFDELLVQAFSDATDNSRLRHLMSNESRIMIVATAVQGDFDEKYDQRLFRQFEHHPIPRWNADDHRDYLVRRAKRTNKQPTPLQLARIDAYSRYTGGNARAAAVLAGAVLDDTDPLQTAQDLDAAIEKMSDYYRNLIDRIPSNTRKLFDALVRGGEPASQTEIAKRIGARQNDISRPFMWLVDQGYVSETRLPGKKTKQYRVLDRLFVQFYRMRSISPGQRSKLALMAELLADTLAFQDKWRYASRYAAEGHDDEARTLVELALKERKIDIKLLSAITSDTGKICALGTGWKEWDAILDAKDDVAGIKEIVRRFPDDLSLHNAIEQATTLLRSSNRGSLQGADLVTLLQESHTVCSVDKFLILILLLIPEMSEKDWSELAAIFHRETKLIEQLEKESPGKFTEMKIELELDRTYPRTISLDYLSREMVSEVPSRRFLSADMATAADWAVHAALFWLEAKLVERASASLGTCAVALGKLSDAEFPEIILGVIKLIEPKLGEFPMAQRAVMHELKAIALKQKGLYAAAYQTYVSARNEWTEADKPNSASRNLRQMAWCQSALGNFSQALTEHRLAFEQTIAQDQLEDVAWNLGQMARCTAAQLDIQAAWALLDSEISKVGNEAVKTIQQLGDIISDYVRKQGEATAFAQGYELLQGLATRLQFPVEASLRALWIDMIDMGVPHGLLRDLLGEWQRLFADRYDAGMQTLNQLLRDWLDDLDTPADTRETRRLTLDPDLATTLTALEGGLSKSAQKRFGLVVRDNNSPQGQSTS